jgi:hypothetical protein
MGWTLVLGLAAQNEPPRRDQEPTPAEQPADQYFSGVIISLAADKVTVSRTVLGATSSRSFAINTETQVEGKLTVKVRVTVKYVTKDEVDCAVHIIVRDSSRK